MKYLIIIMILCSWIYPKYSELSATEILKRDYLYKKYSWMSKKLYTLYRSRSIQFKVPLKLAVCVVQTESHGKKIVSRLNSNGTRDFGRFQVNQVHMPKTPYRLWYDYTNSKYGFMYLKMCLNKSKYLPDTIRMYNQGLNGIKKYYKNWKYVDKVIECYNQDIIKNRL